MKCGNFYDGLAWHCAVTVLTKKWRNETPQCTVVVRCSITLLFMHLCCSRNIREWHIMYWKHWFGTYTEGKLECANRRDVSKTGEISVRDESTLENHCRLFIKVSSAFLGTTLGHYHYNLSKKSIPLVRHAQSSIGFLLIPEIKTQKVTVYWHDRERKDECATFLDALIWPLPGSEGGRLFWVLASVWYS